MKILITGSSGHLGEALMRVLQKREHELCGMDLVPSPFTTHVGSITDRDFVAACMNGVDAVLHTATLHKPHIVTHTRQDFIETNITGTLILLEEAVRANVKAFIYTSTTSTFGAAMHPLKGEPAIWVTEQLRPIPKNIYGLTKTAAEELCELFHRKYALPTLILKVARFFLEEDDDRKRREAMEDENIKVLEFLNRRVDVEDIVQAHLLAMEKAATIGFSRYIISASSPFTMADLKKLQEDASAVLEQKYPTYKELFLAKRWKVFPSLGRVYVNEKARKELGWNPKYDFGFILQQLKEGKDFVSPLARSIGSKGYHDELFEDGPYPVR